MININYGNGGFTDIYIYGGLLHTLTKTDLERGTIVFVFYPITTEGKTGYPAWLVHNSSGTVFDFSMYPTYLKINCNKGYWTNWWNMSEPKTQQIFLIKVITRTDLVQETLFEFYTTVNLYRDQNWPINGISTTSNKFFNP